MGFHEGKAESGVESENQLENRKILRLEGTLSKADRIRGVTRSLVVDAMAVLDDMWEDCQKTPSLMENYYLLHHYLSYLKRFCEGRA